MPRLGLADTEHLSPTAGTFTLGGRTVILHSDGLGILDFNFLSALHTISLHSDLLIVG